MDFTYAWDFTSSVLVGAISKNIWSCFQVVVGWRLSCSLKSSLRIFLTPRGYSCDVRWFSNPCLQTRTEPKPEYHFQWPLSAHRNPPVHHVSNYKCAYVSSGDLVKMQILIQEGWSRTWDCIAPQVMLMVPAGRQPLEWQSCSGLVILFTPNPIPDPFSALQTAAPGHVGSLVYGWVGPMEGGVNGLSQWEATAGHQSALYLTWQRGLCRCD